MRCNQCVLLLSVCMKTGYQGEYYIVEDKRNSIGRPDKRWLYQTEGGSELIPTSGGGGDEEEEEYEEEEDEYEKEEVKEEEYSHSPTYVILNLRKFDFT